MQGEMSQGRNVAQGEMSLREKCRREKSRREKCRREKCLSGRNVVQSFYGVYNRVCFAIVLVMSHPESIWN